MSELASCVFCDIVTGKAPAYKIAENDLSMCILDINPFARGHCLVIPKRHVPWWHELTENEISSLFRLAGEVARKIQKEFKPDFVCMYARGKRVPHTHIFLVPTVSGDVLDRFFNALEGLQESVVGLAGLRSESVYLEVAARLTRP
ncbi:MAG: HIT family protein [Verrucomicrobiae bacterium]|nr:HIT family protein [Verrucomicrobiae bacterium]